MRPALLRIVMVLAGTVVLVTGAVVAPLGLRRVTAFSVQRVEIEGMRYLDGPAAVAASGITARSNIFDDPTPWSEALLRHPLIRAVTITRRLPGTIRLEITESRPVAFARTPELRAIDERGFILPADPAAQGMDLPVIAWETRVSGIGRAADRQTLQVVGFLGTIKRLEPGLLGWISEVGPHGSAVRLILRNAADAEVLLPGQPDADRLRELHLTLNDLAAPRFAVVTDTASADASRTAEPELSRVKRIDGRYHDQIVVALHRGKN
jgi:hypothetical protein